MVDEGLFRKFKEKFSDKSKSELEIIINNPQDYQKEAVLAARLIFKTKNFGRASTDIIKKEGVDSHQVVDEQNEEYGIISGIEKTARHYTSKYTLGDFLSLLSIAFMYCVSLALVDYYANEEWLENFTSKVRWSFTIIFFLSIHFVFKKEHGVSNNFLGRVLHSSQYFSLVIIIRILHQSFQTLDFSFSMEEPIPVPVYGIIIVSLIFISLLEISVGILIWFIKKIFKYSPL